MKEIRRIRIVQQAYFRKFIGYFKFISRETTLLRFCE